MKTSRPRMLTTWMSWATLLGGLICSPPAAAGVLRVPSGYATIQAAVDAAEPGDVIQVAPGEYPERVLIDQSHLRLHGVRAVVTGTNVDGGLGIGIHVVGASHVTIQGFVVENWERGIVLDSVDDSRIHRNEVRNNTDKNPADGCFNMADGIVLSNTHFSTVSQNSVHDNGHNGIFLIVDSSNNIVQGNRSNDNGAQTIVCGVVAGCGIQLSNGANNHNDIVVNETLRNAWGILLGPSGAPTGNFIGQNQSHANPRAGIAMLGDADGNAALQNDATGNGLGDPGTPETGDLPPSFAFDLFDGSTGVNIWLRNKGTANF